jgi:hypothetical protein
MALFVDDIHDVRTSHEKHLWASAACYEDSFTILNADDIYTSQETHRRASTACYGDSFIFPVSKNKFEVQLHYSSTKVRGMVKSVELVSDRKYSEETGMPAERTSSPNNRNRSADRAGRKMATQLQN